MEGEEEEEPGGHGGPELQRTGRCGVKNVHSSVRSPHLALELQNLNQIVSLLLSCQQNRLDPPEQGLGTAEGVLECLESRWDVVRCKSSKVMHQYFLISLVRGLNVCRLSGLLNTQVSLQPGILKEMITRCCSTGSAVSHKAVSMETCCLNISIYGDEIFSVLYNIQMKTIILKVETKFSCLKLNDSVCKVIFFYSFVM